MSRIKAPMVRIRAKVQTVAALDHDVFCAAMEECHCLHREISMTHRNRKGEIGRRTTEATYPKSVTFLVKRITEIEAPALDCPQVAAAIQRGDLRIVP